LTICPSALRIDSSRYWSVAVTVWPVVSVTVEPVSALKLGPTLAVPVERVAGGAAVGGVEPLSFGDECCLRVGCRGRRCGGGCGRSRLRGCRERSCRGAVVLSLVVADLVGGDQQAEQDGADDESADQPAEKPAAWLLFVCHVTLLRSWRRRT
jgi:hypothetical protein